MTQLEILLQLQQLSGVCFPVACDDVEDRFGCGVGCVEGESGGNSLSSWVLRCFVGRVIVVHLEDSEEAAVSSFLDRCLAVCQGGLVERSRFFGIRLQSVSTSRGNNQTRETLKKR